MVIDKVFGRGLNPSFPDYLGSKVGFDATRPFPHTPDYDRAKVTDANLDALDIVISQTASRLVESAVRVDDNNNHWCFFGLASIVILGRVCRNAPEIVTNLSARMSAAVRPAEGTTDEPQPDLSDLQDSRPGQRAVEVCHDRWDALRYIYYSSHRTVQGLPILRPEARPIAFPQRPMCDDNSA